MRRGFCRTIFGVACAVLLHHACLAQITLISGDTVPVPDGPTFAAPSDFDGNGVADVVVSNLRSAAVTVLLGSPLDSPTAGTFLAKIQIPVGRSPRGVTAGDFNQDGKQDIAVADYTLSDVFVIPGNGDGTFRGAITIPVPNRRPIAVAAGNFDNKLGTDIVAASGRKAAITIMLNLGGTKGFSVKPDVGLISIPKAVKTADFDGDGFDDIAVLLPANRTADAVSVLLNNGSGSFQGVIPANYIVGVGGSALTIADFNQDGAKDIAVVNAGELVVNGGNSQRRVSISILLNKTVKTPQGTTIGTGRFSVLPTFEIFCPSTISGIPITCTPQDMGAADFNRDGFNDLVVSFSTTAVMSSQTTAGFVSAFSGRGDGTFDFAAQIGIGLGPRGLATGDYTGDGLPDVAVAEFGESKVTLLRAVAPPPKVKGTPCNKGTECSSSFCVNQVCCETSSCPGDEQCNIHPTEGRCSPPGADGNPCNPVLCQGGHCPQCESDNCVDFFCCATNSCPTGEACNTGTCSSPTANGTRCSANEECLFVHCVDGICCGDDSCASGQFCNIPGFEGQCSPPVGAGSSCDKNTQCQSGLFCTDQTCCNAPECDVHEFCNVSGFEGQCVAVPTAVPTLTPTETPTQTLTSTITSTPTLTATPTATPTPQPTGATCGGGPQCVSNNCINGVCCASVCTIDQRCDIPGKTGSCSNLVAQNTPCSGDPQCFSNNCSGGVCGGTRTPTNTPIAPTPTPVPPGSGCTSAAQCQAGYFCSTPENVCCHSSSCALPSSCRFAGFEGDCTAPTPTATPLLADGDACTDPASCFSDNCVDGVCCDSPFCTDPQRCDIFELEGSCQDPKATDEDCQLIKDCAAGLECDFDSILNRTVCKLPPTPVPTVPLLPTATPSPIGGSEVFVSRSGGCSIGGGSDPAGAWMLAGLPVVLWLRRYRMQRIHPLIRSGGK